MEQSTQKSTFLLHLKECECRFNNRGKNLYLLLLKIISDTSVLVMGLDYFSLKQILDIFDVRLLIPLSNPFGIIIIKKTKVAP